jgi:hypothetical protein
MEGLGVAMRTLSWGDLGGIRWVIGVERLGRDCKSKMRGHGKEGDAVGVGWG